MTFHHLPFVFCTRRLLLQTTFHTRTTQQAVYSSYTYKRQTGSARSWTDQVLQRKMERQVSKIDKYKSKLKDGVVSSSLSVYVVCTGAKGLAKSILIKTNHDRYLFNCGESTQKCLVEVVRNLGPVDNIFFTHNSWNNVGGLMGFMLTNNENLVHNKPMTLHGPPNVDKILQMTRMFSESHVGALARVEWRGVAEKQFEDDQVTIEYVEILPDGGVNMESELEGDQASGAGHDGVGDKTASNETEKTAAQVEESAKVRGRSAAVAYIITPKVLPRKVDINKLFKLQVKSGPWVGKLVNGETVTLPDGREVKPDDVLIEDVNVVNPIVVLECPSAAYLDSLLSNPQLIGLNDSEGSVPELMVHMSPAGVVDDPRYKTFMDRYSSDTVHLMMTEDSAGPYVHGAAILQSTLNLLHPEIFPKLQAHQNLCSPQTPVQGQVIQAMPGLNYTYRPRGSKGFNWESTQYINEEEAIEDMKLEGENVEEELTKLQEKLTHNNIPADPDEYPEIVFLGTGSAVPGTKRNVSSILLQMRKDEFLLLDCGEGTLAQLYQLYGDYTEHILSHLKAVFISHLHYDHHGGLFNIVEKRDAVIQREGRADRLLLLAPQGFRKWIGLYHRHVTDVYCMLLLHPHHFLMEYGKRGETAPVMEMVKQTLGVTEYVPVPVRHVSNSHGIVITHKDGWKFVYSGDTMPCKDLIKYGKDCDYLIHEGTFDDSTPELAYGKNHSTTGEAIEVANEMGARYLILTHFSQRFSRIPNFTDKFTDNVSFAFDFMKVRPSQLALIPLFKPALTAMYGYDFEEKQKKVERRKQLFDEGILEERTKRKDGKAAKFEKIQRDNKASWSKGSKDLISKLKLNEEEAKKTNTDSENVAGPSEKPSLCGQKRKSERSQNVTKVARTGDDPTVTNDKVLDDDSGSTSQLVKSSSPNR